MTVELFTSKQFENALDYLPYEKLGVVNGEFSYRVSLDGQSGLMIRSSVKANDLSAGSSRDSIRVWLVDNENRPLAAKTFQWVTRQPGWQERLKDRMLEISQARALAGDCQKCGNPKGIYKTKQGKNVGKMFVKCFPCDSGFVWFNELKQSDVWFSEVSHGNVKRSCNSSKDQGGSGMAFNRSSTKRVVHNPQDSNDDLSNVTQKDDSVKVSKRIEEGSNMPEVLGNSNSSGLAAFLAEAEKVEPDEPKIVLPPVTWSHYQNDVYDFVRDGKGHGMVHGVAGCGKTRTNVHSLGLLDPKLRIKYAAFNKHIAIDIESKAPSYVDVSTLHKWGLNNIEAAWPKARLDKWKVYDIIDKYKFAKREDYPLKQAISKLVSLLKGSLLEPTDKNIYQLADDFCVDIESHQIGFARRTFNASVADMSKFDLDDMIYFSAIRPEICQKFHFIAIDEFQDLNYVQTVLVRNSLAEDGRILGVGDPMQSMYQFRGAGVGIMDRIGKMLNATQLPLSISYRAPLAIVNLVNEKYPHIQFEAAPNAIPGSIDYIDYEDFYDIVQPNHGVICRTNAPLVAPCFALIRKGIKATILGKDIGKGLLGLIKKREKLVRVKDLDDLLNDLKIFRDNETKKFKRDNKLSRAALLDDQCATIFALATECRTIDDLKHKANTVFSKDRQGITFSSIHKAKGLEWDTVHILEPQLMPHPMARKKRDRAQETNIQYVADTRTKDKLYYVNGE